MQASQKKGGPYTKHQQESRRLEVYRLHFELGYSAVEIAEMMKVSRNTINLDIRFLYEQTGEELQADDVGILILKQIKRFEMQRTRLMNELKNGPPLHDKLTIERLLFDIDNRISQIITKIKIGPYHFPQPKQPTKPEKKHRYSEIKPIIDEIIKSRKFDLNRITTSDIKSEIIRIKKCSVEESSEIFSIMEGLGLHLCDSNNGFPVSISDYVYDVTKFAEMHSSS